MIFNLLQVSSAARHLIKDEVPLPITFLLLVWLLGSAEFDDTKQSTVIPEWSAHPFTQATSQCFHLSALSDLLGSNAAKIIVCIAHIAC